MAVSGGWVGSSAVNETGQRWISAARTTLNLPAYGGWMSEMIGRSVVAPPPSEINATGLYGANDNFNTEDLINWGYGFSNRSITNLTLTISGNITSYSKDVPCLNFAAAPFNEFRSVHLIINSGVRVSGRGGNGASLNMSGNSFKSFNEASAGGVAITNGIGTKLTISNNGYISGGGGGGGAGAFNNSDGQDNGAGGGGGCPFGAGGNRGAVNGGGISGNGASGSGPGTGATQSGDANTSKGGNGGSWGAAGAAGTSSGGNGSRKTSGGGAAGAAVNGSSPNWASLGNINGSRV